MKTLRDLVERLEQHAENKADVERAKLAITHGGNPDTMYYKHKALLRAEDAMSAHLDEPLFPDEL